MYKINLHQGSFNFGTRLAALGGIFHPDTCPFTIVLYMLFYQKRSFRGI